MTSRVSGRSRWLAFAGVSAAGLVVQLAVIATLTGRVALDYRLATVAGVTAAIGHNWIWHRAWTWADRKRVGAGALTTLRRFVLANGATSMAGNLILMSGLVGVAGWPVLPANLVTVAACGLVNYVLADRVVFRRPVAPRFGRRPSRVSWRQARSGAVAACRSTVARNRPGRAYAPWTR